MTITTRCIACVLRGVEFINIACESARRIELFFFLHYVQGEMSFDTIFTGKRAGERLWKKELPRKLRGCGGFH